MAPQNDDPQTPPPTNPTPDSPAERPEPHTFTPDPVSVPTQQPVPPAFTPSSAPQPSPFSSPESPAVSPFVMPQEEGRLTPIKPKSNRKKLLAIIIVAAVAIIGFGGYAAYAFWYNNPQNVVADALSKVATMKTGAAQGFVETSNDGDTTVRFNFNYAQASQREGSITGDLKFSIGDQKHTIKASLVSAKDNKAYVKVENVKKILDSLTEGAGAPVGAYTMFDGLVSKIDNKWVVLTPKDLAGGDEKANEQTECTAKALEAFNGDKKQQDEFFAAYKKNPFITPKQVGTESVNGASSNRYELTLDKQKSRDFVKAAKETVFFKAVDKCNDSELSETYHESKVDQIVTDTAKVKLELWVDQWSHNPTKVKVSSDQSGAKTVFETTIDLSAKPTVTAPKADTTFDDLTAEIEKIQQDIFTTEFSTGEGVEELEQPVLGTQTFLPSYMTRLLQ